MPFATSLPKAEPRWVLGVWLGKHEQSDVHLGGTSQKILVGRSVRCVDDAQTRQCFDQMTWTPWVMHTSSMKTGTGAPSADPEPATSALPVKRGDVSEATSEQKRVRLASKTSVMRERPVPMEDIAPEDTEARGRKRPAEEGADDRVRGDPQPEQESRGCKRAAEEEADDRERGDMQPEDAENMWIDELVFVSKTQYGPPWRDEYTYQILDTQAVEDAMNKEWKSLEEFGVLEPCTWEVAREHGCEKPVGLRWIVHQKPDKMKARIVAQQVNTGEWADTFAATPVHVSQRLLVHRALARGYLLGNIDIGTAFSHA